MERPIMIRQVMIYMYGISTHLTRSIGDEPLSEPMPTRFADAYMRH